MCHRLVCSDMLKFRRKPWQWTKETWLLGPLSAMKSWKWGFPAVGKGWKLQLFQQLSQMERRKAKEKLENCKETRWKDGNCNFFVWPLYPSKIAFRHAICLNATTGEVSTGGLFAFLMAYWRPFAYAICLKTPTWHRNINKTINIHNIRMYICIYLCGSQTYIQVDIYMYG